MLSKHNDTPWRLLMNMTGALLLMVTLPATTVLAEDEGFTIDGTPISVQPLTSDAFVEPAANGTVDYGYPPDPGSGNCYPFGCYSYWRPATRYQQVYDGTFFSGPVIIDKIEFFATAYRLGYFAAADYEIRLSTTSKPVNGLNTTDLSSNVGVDDALFHSVTLGGPTGDEIIFDGINFPYDPSMGNLLLDIKITNRTAPPLPFDQIAFLDARSGSFGTDSSRAHDFGGGFDSYGLRTSFHLLNNNHPPTADANGPYLVEVEQSIYFDGSGSSDPDGDPLTETWTVDNKVLFDNQYTANSGPGIYDVTLVVNDGMVDSEVSTTTVVVYDPSGGFVTGGGWIASTQEMCAMSYYCQGKANFGFVSKYKKGATVPTGQTEFHFKDGNLNFHSDTYQWLVINQGGKNAQFKGTGTINGAGDYKFMLRAGDDETNGDTFHIRIWVEDENGYETDVYDNGTDQPIGGGQIVIHTKDKK